MNIIVYILTTEMVYPTAHLAIWDGLLSCVVLNTEADCNVTVSVYVNICSHAEEIKKKYKFGMSV